MTQYILRLMCLIMCLMFLNTALFADTNPNQYGCIIDEEFANTDLLDAPLNAWASAGSNAIIDSVITINVTAIPDSVTFLLDGVEVPIPEAQYRLNSYVKADR